ncbi:MAG TPA: DNA-deoxyinosine glycosylase [Rhodocyclaceae bacterium]|jgi:hypoxanthine-DNA glycosylase
MNRLYSMPPIIDQRARVLILGSFPSAASLAAQQYYAHPQNQFWRVLAALLKQPLLEMDYANRQEALKNAGIAVWDVFASCERAGSLDSAIRQPEFNDFSQLQQWAPDLQRVCFNGQTAAKLQKHLASFGYRVRILPSTSPAHASRSLAEKIELWRDAVIF